MFRTKILEKIKIHTLCPIFFFFEYRGPYEIMWENIVEPDSPQMTMWGEPIACWIPKATNINSEL